MKTTLQKLDDKKRRYSNKVTELENARASMVQTQIKAIFESIGIKTNVPLRYLSHSSNGIKVTESSGTFKIYVESDSMDFNFYVKDHEDKRLKKIKKLVEIFKSDE